MQKCMGASELRPTQLPLLQRFSHAESRKLQQFGGAFVNGGGFATGSLNAFSQTGGAVSSLGPFGPNYGGGFSVASGKGHSRAVLPSKHKAVAGHSWALPACGSFGIAGPHPPAATPAQPT